MLPEIRNLRQLAERGMLQADQTGDKILDMIGNVRWFFYKRSDHLGGSGSVINWKTNADNKMWIFSELRDSLMLRRIELRSLRLVQQLQAIIEDDGWLGAGPDTGEGDDLAMALALAHHTWVEWKRAGLVARRLTWESVQAQPKQDVGTVLSFAFSQHMEGIARKSRERRERF